MNWALVTGHSGLLQPVMSHRTGPDKFMESRPRLRECFFDILELLTQSLILHLVSGGNPTGPRELLSSRKPPIPSHTGTAAVFH